MNGSISSKPRLCFEVEKVIGISSDGSYQVQWAPAWVSKFQLVGCEHLIEEFLQQQRSEKENDSEMQIQILSASNQVNKDHAKESDNLSLQSSAKFHLHNEDHAEEDFEHTDTICIENTSMERSSVLIHCTHSGEIFVQPGTSVTEGSDIGAIPRSCLFGGEKHDKEYGINNGDISDDTLLLTNGDENEVAENELNVPDLDLEKGSSRKIKRNTTTNICGLCKENFATRSSLNRHMKRKHKGISAPQQRGKSLCLECGEKFYRVSDLKIRLAASHGFHFPTEEFHHNSIEEFESWKLDLEKNNCCNFLSASGFEYINKEGGKVRYYSCNRSGFYIPRHTKRNPRVCGTCKIDNNCTASLHLTRHENGTYTTKCCMVHYGHKPELQHLNKPKDLKQQIAAKLHQGVPHTTIVDQIRDIKGDV